MNIESLIRAARAADQAGDLRKTLLFCDQALSLNPECVEAMLIMGAVAARHGRTGEAEEILREALSIDPASYDAVRWLTTLLIGRNGGGEAVAFGMQAVALRPDDAESRIALGLAAMGNGNLALAISNFEKAAEIHPKLFAAHHNLGVAYQREESYEEAIVAFRRAIQLDPKVVDTYLHLGHCYLAQENGDQALVCANQALQLQPNSHSARQLWADARFAAVQGENGLEHVRQAIEQEPNAAFPQALMGSRLQEQGDFTEAAQYIERSIQLQPVQGFAYYLWAHNRKIQPDDRAWVENIDHLGSQEMEPEDRQYLHFGLGKAYDDLGEYEQAMLHFDLAHEGLNSHEGPTPNRVRRMNQLFSKEVLQRLAEVGLATEEPIFIFGMPRSGTTLLEQIVSRHSRVGAAGELFFWRDNFRRIVDLSRGAMNQKELARAGQRYLDLIRSLAPDKAHVTDKFPSNYVYLGILDLIFPKAKFLHARRDPVDTCLSIYMRPFSTNQGLGRTRTEIVETYKQYRESIAHWRKALAPNRFLDVDYEEMVQNPEAGARRVIDYLGLPWEDACLKPHEGDRRVITFSKWQVRQPVYTTSVARWKRYEPWLGNFRELID